MPEKGGTVFSKSVVPRNLAILQLEITDPDLFGQDKLSWWFEKKNEKRGMGKLTGLGSSEKSWEDKCDQNPLYKMLKELMQRKKGKGLSTETEKKKEIERDMKWSFREET